MLKIITINRHFFIAISTHTTMYAITPCIIYCNDKLIKYISIRWFQFHIDFTYTEI